MILESVVSLLAQRYSLFEVVIVDDGSTDATAQTLIDAYDLRQVSPAPRNKLQYEPVTEMYRGAAPHDITLIRKRNGGRADALNAGLDVARHPVRLHHRRRLDHRSRRPLRDGAPGARGSRARDRRRRHDPRRQLVPDRVGPGHGGAHAQRPARRLPGDRVPARVPVRPRRLGCDRRARDRLRRLRPVPPRRRRRGRRLLDRHRRRGPRADRAPAPAHARAQPPVPDHLRPRSRLLDRGAVGHGLARPPAPPLAPRPVGVPVAAQGHDAAAPLRRARHDRPAVLPHVRVLRAADGGRRLDRVPDRPGARDRQLASGRRVHPLLVGARLAGHAGGVRPRGERLPQLPPRPPTSAG